MRLLFDKLPGDSPQFELNEGKGAILGRMSGGDRGNLTIALPHGAKTVNWSRSHAQFDWDGKEWSITILGGTKPTLLNGQLMQTGKATPLQFHNTLACDGLEILIRKEFDPYKTGGVFDIYKTGATGGGDRTGSPIQEPRGSDGPAGGDDALAALRGRTQRISAVDPSEDKTRPLQPLRIENGQLVPVDDTAEKLEQLRSAAEAALKAAKESKDKAEDAQRAKKMAEAAHSAARDAAGRVRARATVEEVVQAAQDVELEAANAQSAASEAELAARLASTKAQEATDKTDLAQRLREQLARSRRAVAEEADPHVKRAKDAADEARSSAKDAESHARAAGDMAPRAEGLAREARRAAQARKDEAQELLAKREEVAGLVKLYGGIIGALLLAVALGLGLAYMVWRLVGQP